MELTHSIFERSGIKNARLDKSSFYKVDFTDANIEKSSFREAYLKHTSFENANLSKSDFTDCELEFVDFTDADLKGVNFKNARMKGVFFCRTDLTGLKNLDSVEGLERVLFLDVVVTKKEKDIIEGKSNNPVNSFVLKG